MTLRGRRMPQRLSSSGLGREQRRFFLWDRLVSMNFRRRRQWRYSPWSTVVGSLLLLATVPIMVLFHPVSSSKPALARLLLFSRNTEYLSDHPMYTELQGKPTNHSRRNNSNKQRRWSQNETIPSTDSLLQAQDSSTPTTTTTIADTTTTLSTRPTLQIDNETNLPLPHMLARDAKGNFGYVADPLAVKRGVESFLSNHNDCYWKLLQEYPSTSVRGGALYGDYMLSPEYICNVGPGRSFEDDGGFKLLTEKIRIVNETTTDGDSIRRPRIFCGLYTYSKMRELTRVQGLSWGHRCDGYLAFSTETIPELGIVNLQHAGDESYYNMWQKVRAIWTYVYQHYANDYDYFHLGGDDLYVLVENMRKFYGELQSRDEEVREKPLYWGLKVESKEIRKTSIMVLGAPGYTLNREALKVLTTEILLRCKVFAAASHEDRMISKCFELRKMHPQDTRNVLTGEQQYHGVPPQFLYTFRSGPSEKSFYSKVSTFWEGLAHPTLTNQTTGPKHRLEAAAKHSMTLHDMYHPLYVARVHSLLFPHTCPADSNLGKALRRYRSML